MKRSRLDVGAKSRARGSTFAAKPSPLRRGRRKPRGRPTDEQLAARHRTACWLSRFSDLDCRGPLQLCHLIDKQRLRANGVTEDDIWDERVVVNGCEHHHGAVPKGDIPRDELPPGLEEYAAEHGLTWSLDRDFGTLDDVQTAPEVDYGR